MQPISVEDCVEPGGNHRLCIRDRLNGIRFLVDTGANVSVLPVSQFKVELSVNEYKLFAANDTEIKTYGVKTLELNLGLRRSLRWTFIVCDVKQAIIGADFLEYYKLIVDIFNKKLTDSTTNLCAIGCVIRHNQPSIKSIQENNPYRDILEEYSGITKPIAYKEPSHSVYHHIITSGPPVYVRPRPLPPDRYKKVKEEFQKMHVLGICRPGKGEWASPLHVVLKKDGQLRPCGDYRALNAITKPDRYPVPRLQDFTYMLPDKKCFTRLDLNRAYHNIAVAAEDIEKTGICTPFGLYEFPRMSFGLRNAAQTFQRFMDQHVLRGIERIEDEHGKSALFCYIDDILIASSTQLKNKEHLRILFNRLNELGVTVNVNKCAFGQSTVEFLGYTVSENGISPLPDKVKAVTHYKRPETIEQLRRFLGMINFYRSHLPHAASHQAVLNNFLHNSKRKDKTKINWDERSIEAFEQCKESLKSAVTLSHPSEDVPLALMTDASDTCVGGVLQQKIRGKWLPLGYFSKRLSETQQKYSTYDKELAAIYMSMIHFRNMLEGRQLTIFTDHKPLTYAFTKNNSSNKEIPRRARQLMYISEFTSDIQHIKGSANTVADALSRVESILCPTTFDYEELARAQDAEHRVTATVNDKHEFKYVGVPNSDKRIYCEVSTDTVRPYLPTEFRKIAFDSIHNLSHPGIRTTRKLVTKRFFWPGMNKEINTWAKACIPCQKAKISRHTHSALGEFPQANKFEQIHTDIVGPLPTSRHGYRYCITIMDRFTRWPEAIPVSDISADTVSSVIYKEWICRYGCPSRITTDQGRQFESDLFNALMRLLGVCKIRTTAYHPQSNGLIERWHRSLKNALTARLTDRLDWANELPTVMLGLRSALRTDTGFSAAELIYGQPARLPSDFFQQSQDNVSHHEYIKHLRKTFSTMNPQMRSASDNRKIFVNKDLKACTHVFIRNEMLKKSLTPTYEGPYRVLKRTDKVYTIQLPNRTTNISIDRLKAAFVLSECNSEQSENNNFDKGNVNNSRNITTAPMIEASDKNSDNKIVTRSGRVVKPRVRFNL